mgnify:CR=1 FL=1|jgi:hypothetical protein|tara:strand:+ start:15958 stop:16158 length:201 start_codon:yes stop_codon:yes gene_type:complete
MKVGIITKNILHSICIIIIAVLLSILVLKTVGINDKIVEGMLEGMSPEASVDTVDAIGMFTTVKSN